jgi:hypothetical protein
MSKTIEAGSGRVEASAAVGCILEPDGRMGENLLPCEDYSDASFRFPVLGLEIACNVHVTGRKLQYDGGNTKVRVRIEWVGDGEPSTFCGGWLWRPVLKFA